MNEHFVPFNPFSEPERPEWPYWWQRRCEPYRFFAVVGYSRARVIERFDDIKTYSYVVVPQ